MTPSDFFIWVLTFCGTAVSVGFTGLIIWLAYNFVSNEIKTTLR